MRTELYEISAWEFFFAVVRFDLGSLLKGQMMEAKLTNAFISLISGPRGLGC